MSHNQALFGEKWTPEASSNANQVVRDVRGRITRGSVLNPAGRPRGTVSLTSLLRKMLHEVPKSKGKSAATELMEKLVDMALGGDLNALRLILAYEEGLPAPVHQPQKAAIILPLPSEIVEKYKLARE